MTRDTAPTFDRDGFAVVNDVLASSAIDTLCDQLADAGHGVRNLFDRVPQTRILVTEPAIAARVASILGEDAFAVRAILFDKLEGKNWHVGWHQDQAIAINKQVEAKGFGPTSVKHGVPHTRASAEVLQRMLAVRVHLDDCDADNGPLRCVPTSHTLGRLDPHETLAHKERLGEVTCTVSRGGVLLMRPLCLHASSPAKSPRHRRVIHIEFANCELPGEMDWHERQPIRRA
jgi:ectoine hydroxylase-related dioxygenase (phytanoyl-CoA dioxygenase family)